MKVLVYRKCSPCQKALKWLEAHEIAFEACDEWVPAEKVF